MTLTERMSAPCERRIPFAVSKLKSVAFGSGTRLVSSLLAERADQRNSQ